MSELKLSIIVPVYNVAPYLKTCIDSILNQTFKDYELIIVDDGSTDGSENICESYKLKDNRIRVIHQKNKGLSGARNTGIDAARGTYIAFVDSDDYIHPIMYQVLITAIEKNQSDIAICKSVSTEKNTIFTEKDLIIPQYKEISWSVDDALQHITLMKLVVWNKIYRREVIKDIYFEDKAFSEDIGYNFAILKRINSNISFVDSTFYYYRINRQGSSGTKFILENRLKGYNSLNSLLDFVEQSYSKKALISIAHLATFFFYLNYIENKKLTGNKHTGMIIMNYYKKVFNKIPLTDKRIKEILFFYTPNLYVKLKHLLK